MILEGTLVTVPDSPCLQVKPLGEPAIGLLWPSGYRATAAPVRIYSPDGVELAAEGDLVTMTGGAIYKPSSLCHTQSVFEVSQIARGSSEYAP